jgi:4-diphosphocytidyl-2-C-methyl-D-erythritol kinase
MTREARLAACAKLNLDLRVLHKRPDGYHELRTVFQTISLADRIGVAFTPGRRTTIALESATDIPDNLVVRAAELVMEAAKATGRVEFRLTKRIPMGGGLGGGSTDAAAVLLALPVLAGRVIPTGKLAELAAKLGSDVPFFLEGGTALGLGRGEELYPLSDARLGPLLLVAPGVHISTPEAYKALGRDLTFNGLSHSINTFQSFVWSLGEGLSGRDLPGLGVNDFEAVVFHRHPSLRALKGKLLRLGARPALMTGSGSCLFGIFATPEARDGASCQFQGETVLRASAVSRRRYQSMWRRQLRAHITGTEWPPRSRYAPPR